MILGWVFCLIGIGYVQAADRLTVENVSVAQGGTATLMIGCEFDSQFKAFQFDVELQEGLALEVGDDNGPIGTLGFNGTDHTIASSTVATGKYRFVCTSISNAALPTSGTLMQLTIVAPKDAKVGEAIECKITAIEFTSMDYEVNNFDDLNFFAAISEPVDTRTVLDENAMTAPEAATGVNVRVRRTIPANTWSTICLPFAMTEEQLKAAFGSDVLLAEFTGWETTKYNESDKPTAIRADFQAVAATEANKPYIIKVPDGLTEFTADDVTISPVDDPIVTVGKKSKGTFGSFAGSYVAETPLDEECLFLNDGKFWYAEEGTTMKAFRAYFYFQDVLVDYNESVGAQVELSVKTKHSTDLNDDGIANALDIQEIINAAVAESKDSKYDVNGDGMVNALDIQEVINAAAATEARRFELGTD